MNSTSRFTDRVGDYVRYRPSYPASLVDFLHADGGVAPSALIADIGSGTGISTKLFLDAGHSVIAIEPNDAMRHAADQSLGGRERYRSQSGTAEATGLSNSSVDLVAAAQAFHWFNSDSARQEFARILKPDGRIALFWNSRRAAGSPFLAGYEVLLQKYGTDYSKVSERYSTDEAMQEWFGTGLVAIGCFDNVQYLDYEGLQGRLMSSSYAPRAGHPNHEPMLEALRELFDGTAHEGKVALAYDTRVFVGTPKKDS